MIKSLYIRVDSVGMGGREALKWKEVDAIGEVCNSFNYPLTTHLLQ